MTHLHARDDMSDDMHNADAQIWERISRSTARSALAGPAGLGVRSSRGAEDGSGPVGVVLPTLAWPMMSPILSAISHVLDQSSRELALYSVPRKHDRVEFIQRIVGMRQIEGLIAIYPDAAATLDEATGDDRRVARQLSQVYKQGIPVTIIDDQTTHDGVPWVSADNRQGATDAVRHLIRLGHRRIAHISGPQAYLCAQDRLAGYRAALSEAHLPFDPALEIDGDFTAASGWAGAIYLLTLPNPPTAIFAASDDIAQGVLTAVQQHGLLVPKQVAVVGFDDAGPMWSIDPPLTTVRQPFYDMGWWAATRLMNILATPYSRRTRRQPPLARERAGHASHTDAQTPESRAVRDHLQLPVTLTQRVSSGASRRISSLSRPSSSSPGAVALGELIAVTP